MCRHWGYERLAAKNHDESIGEMKHADEVIEHILFLEGVPNLQKLEKIVVSEEAHVGWLETQLGLLEQLGNAPYLAEQLRK